MMATENRATMPSVCSLERCGNGQGMRVSSVMTATADADACTNGCLNAAAETTSCGLKPSNAMMATKTQLTRLNDCRLAAAVTARSGLGEKLATTEPRRHRRLPQRPHRGALR